MEKQIPRGDSLDLFVDMVNAHHRSLEKYIGSLAHDSAQTQDIIQESYLKAFENLNQLKTPAAFYPWIKKIAFRIHLQKEGRGEEISPFMEERHDSEQFSPESLIEKDDDGRKIRSSINNLKREDRRIILLFFVFNYSHRDIALKYGISISAARKRLERAKGKLEKELGDLMRKSLCRSLPGNDSLYDTDLESSFEKASWFGELSLIEAMLLDGVDVNERDLTGRTLLHYAALRGNEEAVDLLLRYRADRTITDRSGKTPGETAFVNKRYSLWEKLKQGGRNV